jgi:hypothetical protein
MLPANTIVEITTNLAALHLEPNTAAQILAAVFAPLLRTGPNSDLKLPQKRARLRARKALRRKKPERCAPRPAEARERAGAFSKAFSNRPGLSHL